MNRNLRSRIERASKRLEPLQRGPLTLFLRVSKPDLPVVRRVVWDGQGLEIVFDPARGLPPLPAGGPHKLMLHMDPDWV